MAKFKSSNYAQTRMVPVDIENQLIPGTLEHAIHYLVDNGLIFGSDQAKLLIIRGIGSKKVSNQALSRSVYK